MNRLQGFTLLEVLVAMAILAITLGTIIKTVGSYADSAAYLKQRTISQWVAENKAAEIHIQKLFPSPGSSNGESTMANQTWKWEIKVTPTQNKNINRLDISVFPENDENKTPISRLITYAGKPL